MDEIEELRKANPVSLDEAARAVALDRRSFIDSMQDGEWQLGSATAQVSRRSKPSLGVLAAAAVILGLLGFAVTTQLEKDEVIEASVASPGNDGDAIQVQLVGRSFDRSTDLLVLHFDFGDASDAHAAVAAREVTAWFDLDPVVVAGTHTNGSSRTALEYSALMDSAWDDLWLDAALDRPTALDDSLVRWLQAIDAGGQVWVAEGGVSDFTAAVIRAISQQRPDVDTQTAIRLVQHSERNEAATGPSDLAYVQANTTYRRIDPGTATNATANLSAPSEGFEAAALSGTHGDRWSQAFDYLPAEDLDFPDAVLLLDILGVGIDQVNDAAGYVTFFIGDQPDAGLREDS